MKRTLVLGYLLIALSVPAATQLAGAQPEWYLPVTDSCRLFVQEYGTGSDTVVVLHGGFGHDHGYMLDALKGLEGRYHLVFYDQRGSLRSPCPINQLSLQAHVEDLERLRAALGEKQISIVAHSAGTLLAMNYLQEHPDRVKGLILLGALPARTPKTDEEKALWTEQRAAAKAFRERPEIAAQLKREGLDKDAKVLSPKEETTAWRIRFAGDNMYHVERWREMKGGRVFYSLEADKAVEKTIPKEYDLTPALAAHSCPVWIVMGDHDYVDPGAKKHYLVVGNLPNVHIKVIKDAGHAAWHDGPKVFRQVLLKGLGSTSQCR